MTEAEWIAFLQRPEIPAFNRAMLVNPDDDLPRLVFADWMDENCPDTAVNQAVRGSITNEARGMGWPRLPASDVWDLTVTRGRLRKRIKQVNRYRVLPSHRRPLHLIDAVWRCGWVDEIEFGRGHHKTLAEWFEDPGMSGVSRLSVHGYQLFPHHLQRFLASPHLSRVATLTLDAWHYESDIVGIFATSPLIPRLRRLHLSRFSFDLVSVVNFADLGALAGLETLSLANCQVGDAGAMALAQSPHLTNLKHLHLDRNGIHAAGAAALANSPYLCEAIRDQWRRPTDDGGANR